MAKLNAYILGIGAWGPKFRNWDDLSQLLSGADLEDDGAKGPKPEVIPANERRRAPLPVRLAVESSWQAVEQSGIPAEQLPCVFVSGIGDTQLTDYMCRVLAGENKALSPTKFHNSVHNAAAGYWTISTNCMQAANSVAGFEQSVSLTLMEALIQSTSEQTPILITFYDAPSSEVLKDMLKTEQPFSVSMVISPNRSENAIGKISAQVTIEPSIEPSLMSDSFLQDCFATNPAAKILPLIERLASNRGDNTTLKYPLSSETSLSLIVEA